MVGNRIVPASILLVLSALLLLFLAPGAGVKASNWDTTYTLVLSNTAPGANADSTTIYNLTQTDTNFAQILSATGYPESNIALDSQIPDGSDVGVIVSNTTLSVFNGPCVTPVIVTIPFMDCTTDTLDTVPWIGSGDNLVQDNDGDMNEDGSAAPNHDGDCVDGQDNDGDGDADGEDYDGDTVIEDPECNQDGSDPYFLLLAEDGCAPGSCFNGIDDGPACDGGGVDGADELDTDCQEAKDTNDIPTYCDHYPAFLNDIYDPDGPGGAAPIRPRARYEGHQVVIADAPSTQLNFVIFNPEALSAIPTIGGQMGDTYGFIDFVVLNNPVQAVSPSTITDFCAPLTSTPTLEGQTAGKYTVTPGPEPYEVDAAGHCNDGVDQDGDTWPDDGCLVHSAAPAYTRSENPGPLTGLFGTGTHVVRTYSQSYRDVDNDGVVNNLDSCPYLPNTGVDADGDGLDSACDPNDGVASAGAPAACAATSGIPDEDQDCFPNRQDNCPLVRNGDPYDPVPSGWDQSDTDTPSGSAPADLGPSTDGIGDRCDTNPNTPDGHYHVAMPIAYACIPDPYGGDNTNLGAGDTDGDTVIDDLDSDDDGDGVCDSTEDLLGSDPTNPASTPEHEALDLVIGTGTAAQAPGTCSDFLVYNHPDTPPGGVDNDLDGLANALDPDCQSPDDSDEDAVPEGMDNCANEKNQEQVDSDGDGVGDECDDDDDNDGFGDDEENNIGTDPKDSCADDSSDDAWPLDFDMDEDADIVDVLKFKPVILKPKEPGGHRYDFDADGDIDIVDVLKFKPYILTSCHSSESIHANLLEDPDGLPAGQPGSCEDGIDNGGDTLMDLADPDCQVNDITIEWKYEAGKFISATDDSGGTWSLVDEPDEFTWVLERIAGVMTSSETLTIVYDAYRPVEIRCYDWSLDGVMKNSSHKPCRFHVDTPYEVDDLHLRYVYMGYGGVLTDDGTGALLDFNIHRDGAKDMEKSFVPPALSGDVLRLRPWVPSRAWDLKNWYWTTGGLEVFPADKFVAGVYLDDASAYPNEGVPLPEILPDVFEYPVPILPGEQIKVSVVSVDENLGPYVPAKSNVTFLADIPLDCEGVWVKDPVFWPYDILTKFTYLLDPTDLMSQLSLYWDVEPEKVPGLDPPYPFFESDLHFQPNDYTVEDPPVGAGWASCFNLIDDAGDGFCDANGALCVPPAPSDPDCSGGWEEVGVPLPMLRFFDLHCNVEGFYTFTFCNKIEPKGHGFGDPNMDNNYDCVDLLVTVGAPD